MTAMEKATTNLLLSTFDQDAVMRHLNLNPRDPATQALLLVCQKYDLDPILKHALLIKGRLYVTRDGLLHVAHRSGVFDGMEVIEQGKDETHFTAKVSVWRKDMGRPFSYIGRYPKSGQIAKDYGPEMAVKVAEVMALRRAFDVALGAAEERWDEEAQRDLAQADNAQPAQAVQQESKPAPAQDPMEARMKLYGPKLASRREAIKKYGIKDAEVTQFLADLPDWRASDENAENAVAKLTEWGTGLKAAQQPAQDVVDAELKTEPTRLNDGQRKALMAHLSRGALPNTSEARSGFYAYLAPSSVQPGTRTNDLTAEQAHGLLDLLSGMDTDSLSQAVAEYLKGAAK